MAGSDWIDALPDLVLHVRRDGVVLGSFGGSAVAPLRLREGAVGTRVDASWPGTVSALVRQLTRKAIARRATTEARFRDDGQDYEARVTPQGPDRAICVIRALPATDTDGALESADQAARPQLDRRHFVERFRGHLALATLCERPLALAVIEIGGVGDIARLVDEEIARDVVNAAVLRLAPAGSGAAIDEPAWYAGQLSERVLAIVLETSARPEIEALVSRLCASLCEPVHLGPAAFQLAPSAGVAILGEDSTSANALVEHARTAAAEARRAGSASVGFFSDALRVRSLARLDGAGELRKAVEDLDIRPHYIDRRDLRTGRLVTRVGYLRWTHPVRGDVRPAEFLGLAEATGLAVPLSRAALNCIAEDFANERQQWDPDVRISFGPLRHHLLHGDFVADVRRLLIDGAIPPERLEFRIAERTLVAIDPAVLTGLSRLGVRLVVDEVARGVGSLDALARGTIWGLQLDRAWTTALRLEDVALKVCRAGIAVAHALELTPIATGVDDEVQRESLLALGCVYGSGDLYIECAAERRGTTPAVRAG